MVTWLCGGLAPDELLIPTIKVHLPWLRSLRGERAREGARQRRADGARRRADLLGVPRRRRLRALVRVPVDLADRPAHRAWLRHAGAAELARALAGRIDELVDRLEARHPDAIRAWFADRPELVQANRDFERDSILAELWCLADGARMPAELPAADAALTRMSAQLGAPLQFLLWGYRNGHRVQWEGWLDLVERLPGGPAERRRALLDEGARFFFAYVDRMSDLVTEAYTQERERTLRGLEQRRVRTVARLLGGEDAEASELDYDVDGAHLGAILWGQDGPGVAHALAAALDRRALVVAVDRGLWWAWVGGARPLGDALATRLAGWTPPDGTAVALGGEAAGRAGFRATHRQAGAAHRAGQLAGAPLTAFDDVALEALGAADPEAARAFVARELAGLDGDDGRSAALRDTLRAWFAHGHNAAATAAALGVHEQTVAQRLRAVEQRTGRAPAARRAELEMALRLRDYGVSGAGAPDTLGSPGAGVSGAGAPDALGSSGAGVSGAGAPDTLGSSGAGVSGAGAPDTLGSSRAGAPELPGS